MALEQARAWFVHKKEAIVALDIAIGTINPGMYGWERARRKPLVDAFSQWVAVDVVAFQELTQPLLDDVFSQHDRLKFAMGEPMATSEPSYNAIAYDKSRIELVESGTIWLTPSGEKGLGWDAKTERNATWAHLRTKEGGVDFLVVNTQLDNISHQARLCGMKKLLQFLRSKKEALPKQVLIGDFNWSINTPSPLWTNEKKIPYYLAVLAGLTDAILENDEPRALRPQTFSPFKEFGACFNTYGLMDPDGIFTCGFRVINCNIIANDDDFPKSDHAWLVAYLTDPKEP